jgi:two-component system sensor histidine kinase EvgS
MPVMNGYDLVRSIRQLEQSEQRPRCTVLGYTANAQPEETQRCREAGMDDCLFKPISLTALNERLAKVRPLPTPPVEPPMDVFDPHTIQVLTGGRADMTDRLLDQLLDSLHQDRAELDAASDPLQLKDIGHKIRGAANIIDATYVIEGCEALESACDAAAAAETLAGHQAALGGAMAALEQGLMAYRRKTLAQQQGAQP